VQLFTAATTFLLADVSMTIKEKGDPDSEKGMKTKFKKIFS
jgi:hypothetical protein